MKLTDAETIRKERTARSLESIADSLEIIAECVKEACGKWLKGSPPANSKRAPKAGK